jgi:hypothetical protein
MSIIVGDPTTPGTGQVDSVSEPRTRDLPPEGGRVLRDAHETVMEQPVAASPCSTPPETVVEEMAIDLEDDAMPCRPTPHDA